MINQLSIAAKNYWEEIPKKTGQSIVKGMTAAFVVSTVLYGNLAIGCQAGALSGLATAIYGFVTPLFKKILEKSTLSWNEEMCRAGLSAISACTIAIAAGSSPKIVEQLTLLMIVFAVTTPPSTDINAGRWIPIFPH